MKRTLLMICALAVVLFACSKADPGPSNPVGPGGGTHDTTPAPPKHDTTPTPPAPPPTEPPGKSVVVGMYSITKYLDNSGETDGWGIWTYVRLMDKDTSYYSAEILNAYKGTCKITLTNKGDSEVVFNFSNVYYNTTGKDADATDSAGMLQLHVFRKDGKNIKSGVKDVYMVMSTYVADVVGQGTATIGAYHGDRSKLTIDSLLSIISRKSTQTLLNTTGF